MCWELSGSWGMLSLRIYHWHRQGYCWGSEPAEPHPSTLPTPGVYTPWPFLSFCFSGLSQGWNQKPATSWEKPSQWRCSSTSPCGGIVANPSGSLRSLPFVHPLGLQVNNVPLALSLTVHHLAPVLCHRLTDLPCTILRYSVQGSCSIFFCVNLAWVTLSQPGHHPTAWEIFLFGGMWDH